MADIKRISSNEELLLRLKNFIDDPQFNPRNQNKYFFSDGLSYYQQLVTVLRVLDNYGLAFKDVYDNEKLLAENSITTDKLDIAIAELKASIEEEIESIQNENKTKFDSADSLLNAHTSQLATLQQSLSSKLSKVEFDSYGATITDNGIKDGVQKFTVIVEGGSGEGGASLTPNLTYANSNQSSIVTELVENTEDNTNVLKNELKASVIEGGTEKEMTLTSVSFSADDFKRDGNGNIKSNLDTSMFATTSEIDTLSQKVSLNTLDITTLENDNKTNKSNISSLQTNVSTNKDNISTLQTNVSTNTKDINTNKTNITNLTTRVSNVETVSNKNATDINSLEISNTSLQNALSAKQDTLVSGTNIKTINNVDILGTGNLVVSGKWGIDTDNILSTSLPYTATQDCFALGSLYAGSTSADLKVNGYTVTGIHHNTGNQLGFGLPLKKGDTVTLIGNSVWLRIYALK